MLLKGERTISDDFCDDSTNTFSCCCKGRSSQRVVPLLMTIDMHICTEDIGISHWASNDLKQQIISTCFWASLNGRCWILLWLTTSMWSNATSMPGQSNASTNTNGDAAVRSCVWAGTFGTCDAGNVLCIMSTEDYRLPARSLAEYWSIQMFHEGPITCYTMN